jgi:hypothetical protein
VACGRRAVAAEPSDHFANYGLVFAYMSRKDVPAFTERLNARWRSIPWTAGPWPVS